MAKQTINIGASPNDGTGTPLRTSFDYCNLNFTELYAATGPSGNNIVVPGNATITGDLTVDTSTLKVDSTNDRVGIVQAAPLYPLHLVGEFGLEEASAGNGTKLRLIGDATKYNFRLGKQLTATNTFEITPSTTVGGTTFSNPVYTVSYDGIHTFLDGGGGTRMTLNASGNLLVGTTSSSSTNTGSFIFSPGTSGYGGVLSIDHSTSNVSGSGFVNFNYNTTNIGSISQNGTTGVLYNIVSDYRLKESIVPISGGLARVNALKPSVYNWKSDGSTGEGFLAHELAEVVPFAVTGEKDAVDKDGKIKPQGIDMSRIVPILVAAIQELTARVQTLEAK